MNDIFHPITVHLRKIFKGDNSTGFWDFFIFRLTIR